MRKTIWTLAVAGAALAMQTGLMTQEAQAAGPYRPLKPYKPYQPPPPLRFHPPLIKPVQPSWHKPYEVQIRPANRVFYQTVRQFRTEHEANFEAMSLKLRGHDVKVGPRR